MLSREMANEVNIYTLLGVLVSSILKLTGSGLTCQPARRGITVSSGE